MDLYQKDIVIVIGPTRTGKGTLLNALSGEKIKLFKKASGEVKESDISD